MDTSEESKTIQTVGIIKQGPDSEYEDTTEVEFSAMSESGVKMRINIWFRQTIENSRFIRVGSIS